MEKQEKAIKIIELIKKSTLDQTIKDILIRDLDQDGLTDFLKEQIRAYCLEERKNLDAQEAEALKILQEKNPA